MTRNGFLALVLAFSLGACGPDPTATADERGSEGSDVGAAGTPAKSPPGKGAPLVFVPRNRGAPEIIVGGGTRGVHKVPRIQALVTQQVGLTLESQPTLYWYLEEAVDAQAELSIVFGPTTKPLVDRALSGPLKAGVQKVKLADFGVKLVPGVTYQWTIRVMPDASQRSVATITGGAIEVVEQTPELRASLGAAGEAERARVLAEAGIWYDCIDAISRQIDAAPGDAGLRLRRAELLEGVGLEGIAAAERAAAGA
jgi:hypothetical protein